MNSLFTTGNLSLNYDLLSCQLFPVGSFFLISSYNFYQFREKLLKVLNIILCYSLFVYFIFLLTHLPTFYIGEREMFLIFNVQGYERLSSLYWEPGQCQIVIIFTLCLFTDELRDTNILFKNIKKFGLLIIALLFTISTTGYLAFTFFILSILFFSTLIKKHKVFIPVIMVVAIGIIYLVSQSDAIQNKLEERENADSGASSSYVVRLSDNLALIELTMSSPWIGYGFSSKQFERQSEEAGNHASSNGWLLTSACYGVPFLLFIMFLIILGLKRIKGGLSPFLIIIVLLISHSDEYFIFFPYLLMYVFKYPDYRRINLLKG